MRPDEGVKAMRPTRGWKKSPLTRGVGGVMARGVGGKTRPRRECFAATEEGVFCRDRGGSVLPRPRRECFAATEEGVFCRDRGGSVHGKEGWGGVGGNSTLTVPRALFRLETNPPGPPCQGGKGDAPRRGGKGHAPDEGVEEKPPLSGG